MRLRRVATLNPTVPGLGKANAGDEISFVPLECVWSDERFDASRSTEFTGDVQSYNPVAEGDILVPKVSPTFAHGRTCIAKGLRNGRALATSEVFVLRSNAIGGSAFLRYRLLANDFLEEGQASWFGVAGLKRISAGFLLGVEISEVAWEAREDVATFLDAECARIGALSAETAELRSELRECLVSELAEVFEPHGLVPLSEDVGTPLGALVKESDQRSGGLELPLLSVTIDRGVVRRDQLTKDLPRADDLRDYKRVQQGDIVVNRMRAFQGAVGVAPEAGLVSPDYLVLVVLADLRAELVAYALASHRGAELMRSRLRGIGGVSNGAVRTPRINAAEVLSLRIALPSLAQQDALVAELRARRLAVDGLQRELSDFDGALRTYRSGLITELVTGQISVRQLSDSRLAENLAAAREGERPEVLST